jgi:hypothetical protein
MRPFFFAIGVEYSMCDRHMVTTAKILIFSPMIWGWAMGVNTMAVGQDTAALKIVHLENHHEIAKHGSCPD